MTIIVIFKSLNNINIDENHGLTLSDPHYIFYRYNGRLSLIYLYNKKKTFNSNNKLINRVV